jgi:hypothetical protein
MASDYAKSKVGRELGDQEITIVTVSRPSAATGSGNP